ncbi:MAG: hypothetical protein H6711_09550 [Myxococcales bacterium]|nr:hypothetical protein [Myxococcales bacterium]
MSLYLAAASGCWIYRVDSGETEAGESSGGEGVCTLCEAADEACALSQACQEVLAVADACPDGSFIECVHAGACEVLGPDEAAVGLGLFSERLQCVAERCVGVVDRCALEEATCDGNPSCVAITACIHERCVCDFGDAAVACWGVCATEHSSGKAAWDAWMACQPNNGA